MSLSKRDSHLKEYLPADVIKVLDEAEKTVLFEEFANSELKVLAGQPIETIKARLSVHLQSEFNRRLTQIQADEYESLKPWYMEICHTVDEIYCMKCGALLAIEIDTIDDNMNPAHHEGKYIVPIGDKLMAYRPRLDGVMGYQCGNIYQTPTAKKAWDKYDKDFAQNEEEFAKILSQHNKEAEAWASLPDKKREKTPVPEAPTKPHIEPPEEPRTIECDNYTLWSEVETNNIPEDHVMTSITKEDRIKVKQDMNATNYEPDVKETKRGKTIETFELRKVK